MAVINKDKTNTHNRIYGRWISKCNFIFKNQSHLGTWEWKDQLANDTKNAYKIWTSLTEIKINTTESLLLKITKVWLIFINVRIYFLKD